VLVVNFLPIMRSLRSLATDTCINAVGAARNLETQSAPANRGGGWCSVCGVVYSTPCDACRLLQDLWLRGIMAMYGCCRCCHEHGYGYVCSCAVGCKFTCDACNYVVVRGGGGPLTPSCSEECNLTGRVEAREGVCDLCSGLSFCEELAKNAARSTN
jgi:hypothetical protein